MAKIIDLYFYKIDLSDEDLPRATKFRGDHLPSVLYIVNPRGEPSVSPPEDDDDFFGWYNIIIYDSIYHESGGAFTKAIHPSKMDTTQTHHPPRVET